MNYGYRVYFEADLNIEVFGIAKRVAEASRAGKIPPLGFISEDDLPEYLAELLERKFFDEVHEPEVREQLRALEILSRDLSNGKWLINKPKGIVEVEMEKEDFLVVSGFLASSVLTPEEVAAYDQFGFPSAMAFVGAVGAHIHESRYLDRVRRNKIYPWENERDGVTLETAITGDHDLDIRIEATDVSPYPIQDPLGNKVQYKPLARDDKRWVVGYHSDEPRLLVALLKYAEQNKVNSELLKYSGLELLRLVDERQQAIGAAAECLMPPNESRVFESFILFDEPLKDIGTTEERNPYFISGKGGQDSRYGFYTNAKGNFIVAYEDGEKREVVMDWAPAEFDHVVTSLFFQAASGRGRTSVNTLASIVQYKILR